MGKAKPGAPHERGSPVHAAVIIGDGVHPRDNGIGRQLEDQSPRRHDPLAGVPHADAHLETVAKGSHQAEGFGTCRLHVVRDRMAMAVPYLQWKDPPVPVMPP